MKRFVTLIAISLTVAFIAGCPKKPTIVKEEAKAHAVDLKKAEDEEKARKEAEAAEKAKAEARAEAEEEARIKEEAEARLREEEARAKAEAEREFRFEEVYFDFDRYDIREIYREDLSDLADWLLKNKGVNILIEGHCDEKGSNEYNLALGDRRAHSIKTYLTNLGVNAARIDTVTYGEEMPVCTDPNEECRGRNRRAAFRIGLMSIAGEPLPASPLPKTGGDFFDF